MSRHLEHELEDLKKLIFSLGTQVEENVELALKSFEENLPSLVDQVFKNDSDIDQLEVKVEETCLKILALHQPVAVDLRFIIAVLKMTNDLERISSLASGIAKNSILFNKNKNNKNPLHLNPMSGMVTKIVHKCIDSLMNMDVEIAREVVQDDQNIDEMKKELKQSILDELQSDSSHAESLVALLTACNRLERIGDHAQNIAEDVIYLIDAEIIRHQDKG